MSCQSWFAWTCFLATLIGASAGLCANSTSSTLNRKDGGCKKAVSEPENVTWSPTHSSQSTTDYFGDSFTTTDTVQESSTVSVFGSVETYTQEDNIGDCARSCLAEKNCFSIVYGEIPGTPAEQKCGRQFTEIGRDKLDQVNAMNRIEAYGNSQMEPITSFPNCTSFVYIPSHGIWEIDNGNLSNTENYKNCRILLVTEANSTLLVAANINCYDDCHCSDQLRIHNIRSIESNDQSKNATLCLRPSFNQSVATGALSSDGAYVIVELNIDAKSPVDFSLLVYSKCAGCNETLPCGSDGVCQKLVDEDNSTLTDSKCLRPESYSESCSFIPTSIGNTTNDTTANLYSLTTQTSSETPTSSIDYTSNSVSISANPSIGVTDSGVGSTGITDASTSSSNLDISTVDPGDSTTDNGLATTDDGLVTANSAISDTETSITIVGVSSSGAGLSTTSSNSAKTDVDGLTTDSEISTIDTGSSNVHRASTIDLTGTPSVENTHKSIPDSYTTTTNIDSTDNANQNVTGGDKQLAATTNTDQTTQFLSVDNKSTSSPVITSLGVAACNGNASCMDNSNGNSTTSTTTTIAGSNKNDNNKTITDNDDSTTTASNIDNNSTVDNSVNISSSSGSTSPPIGIVVGGVVGGLIALLLLVIVIVLLSRQQRKNKINPGNGFIRDSEYVLTSPPPAATSPGAPTTATATATATATVTMTST